MSPLAVTGARYAQPHTCQAGNWSGKQSHFRRSSRSPMKAQSRSNTAE